MRFTLDIELGNDAMRTGDDVAHALRRLAAHLAGTYDGMILPDDEGTIRDANGNTVGRWEIGEPESAESIARRAAADIVAGLDIDPDDIGPDPFTPLGWELGRGITYENGLKTLAARAVHIARGH